VKNKNIKIKNIKSQSTERKHRKKRNYKENIPTEKTEHENINRTEKHRYGKPIENN
jgi:hypothetical protein